MQPFQDKWASYAVFGACALLALTVVAVGTLALTSLGRDRPPETGLRDRRDAAAVVTVEVVRATPSSPTLTRAGTPSPVATQPLASSGGAPAGSAEAQGTAIGAVQPSAAESPQPRTTTVAAIQTAVATPAPTRTEARTAPRAAQTRYTVKPGETLTQIGSAFGVSVDSLLATNAIERPEQLKAGQELLIPVTSGLAYEVKSGDTLLAIARAHGVEMAEVAAANELDGEYRLQVGQKLLIPGVSPLSVAVAGTPRPPGPSPAAATAAPGAPQAQATPAPAIAASPAPTQQIAPPAPANVNSARPALGWPLQSETVTGFSPSRPGVDLMADIGSPVRAAGNGEVVGVLRMEHGYGWQIILDHGAGLSTLYGHMADIYVTLGQRVQAGQTIGAAGQSGDTSGPKLHFELMEQGRPVDPKNYLP